jgi:hypothetical protein
MNARQIGTAVLMLCAFAPVPSLPADDLILYEGPSVRIEVTPNALKQVEQVAEYDDPLSTTPSRLVTITKDAVLTLRAFEELASDIQETGFFSLGEQYGASDSAAAYPYTISVRYRNKAKTVIYRSGGDATKRPVAFANAQDRIMKFAKRITARAR